METTYFTFVQAGYIALTAICLAFLLIGIRITFNRMGLPAAVANKRMAIITAALTVWLLCVSTLSLMGVFSDFKSLPPKMFLAIIIPLIVILWLTFSSATKRFFAAVPPGWMMAFQVFRVPVELFLWLQFLDGLTPVQMTFEGFNWDVLTGITAPVFAYLCYGQGRHLRGLAIIWNLAGLVLVINIVVISILSAPVPFRTFYNEPANTVVTQFPVILLPAVLVPLAYGMHLFSLRKALMEKKVSRTDLKSPSLA
ncbi:hypothetical protein ACFSRY_16925 [Pontibacter locisalis]|uniref:Uncharacterized protein n=1 Tax=Pontibacter locisalis TaxID=1719035 RepID=A0ABW5IQB3_9BACT